MEEEEKIISAPDEEQLWEEVTADFKIDPDPLEYHIVLEQQDRRVILDIYNNHAMGFEAVAYTNFSAYLFGRDDFRFSVHQQSLTDEIGKIFGVQDVSLGFPDFDERFVIKTNNKSRVINLFEDPMVRNTLLGLPEFSFEIIEYSEEDENITAPFLELRIHQAIADPLRLKEIYRTFLSVLKHIE